ncbi:MAG: sigma-54 dependent transcriptional regulator [Phycisphaerae bacterium]|nr:MAG: sigma-54-dependent Fis family transcriptional regulator [Planctomycetota bacterium]KAB2949835.1 MAG: sigma-54-dependent Fis family transcriptional regulator [Phycisphaerae bacterium]MBE7456959.1 sigma-54-dependent Fis family transcriptional regulator [Planctomycetia bacterium]MCK6463682.1 sigma-54 dependent transcriptional regulator [Phycisphaerae bacterium]MCL4718351.1 sigma-54 dependent transcriptional regulator [Phycisphaerae bacterium]
MAHILVVEDEEILAKNLADALRYAGHEVTLFHAAETAVDRLEEVAPDLVLLDLRLPGMTGLELLAAWRGRGSRVPAIIMTAHGNIETAVEAIKAGADDFLTKPIDLKELGLVVGKTLDHQRVVDNLDYFKNRERSTSGVATLLGTSAAMEEIRAKVQRLARSTAIAGEHPPSVLITGETGTGKDLLARAIHYEGPRSGASFVHVNCTAVPDELFEAELFGHVKGAFTSAQSNKKGLMEIADGGTIFFDEIGHMKPSLQAKLLTALEHRTIRPVGGTKERQVNVHVISATNRDLEAAIAGGEFRRDLYHRLRVVPIEMPPLRGRGEDVELLAKFFLDRYRARFGSLAQRISDGAMDVLRAHDWPGNVRELSHMMESVVLMSDAPVIEPHHLPLKAVRTGAVLEVELHPSSHRISVDFDSGKPVLEDLEYKVLKAALEYSGNNLSRAARMLGVTRDAIRYRINRYEEEHASGRKPDAGGGVGATP